MRSRKEGNLGEFAKEARLIEDEEQRLVDVSRGGKLEESEKDPPVSYTHLTLPTTPYV